MPKYDLHKLKKVGDLVADIERATALRPEDERATYRKAQQSVVDARRKAQSRASLRRIA